MSTMSELHTELGEPVTKAASWAANTWHGLLEAEEIESELWIEILKSDATLKKVQKADPGLLFDLLSRMAARICMKERDDYEHFTGNYRYSVNEAKFLVEEYFLRDGETLMAEYIDIEVALEQMLTTDKDLESRGRRPTRFYEVLYRRYALGQTASQGGDMQRQTRACTKLADLMNKNFKDREREHRDGPGTRTPMARGYDPYEGN